VFHQSLSKLGDGCEKLVMLKESLQSPKLIARRSA